jgi:hypothetical protein
LLPAEELGGAGFIAQIVTLHDSRGHQGDISSVPPVYALSLHTRPMF